MSFDGTEGFVGLDEDAAAANECADTFLDNAIRSNSMALRLLGHQVTWTPRTYDSDDLSQKEGIRPYASYARSSILSVPWIVQAGDEVYHIAVHCRVADEHGQSLSTRGFLKLAGIAEQEFVFTNSDGASPDYKAEEATLTLAEPQANERFTDLLIEQKPVALDTFVIDSSAQAHAVSLQGAYVSGNGLDDIMQQAAVSPPDGDDRHLMAWYNEDAEQRDIFDFMWASPVSDFAYMRPVNANPYISSQDCSLRPLPYVQVRAIEIHNVWSPDFDMRPQGRYEPDRVVDGRDAIEHAIVIDRIYRRKRCLWVGPVGTLGDQEVWEAGYGPRFARVEGSTTAQLLFTASIQPRTKDPKLLLLLNLLPTWNTPPSFASSANIFTLEKLEKAIEVADWTFDVDCKRFANGSSTPGTIASLTEGRELEHYPQLITALSPALQSEEIVASLLVGGAFKEGQLFEEDHALIQRVALELDLTGYNPSTNDMPCFVNVSLSTEALAKFTTAEVDDDTSTLDEGDLVVACTGATIWEVPQ